MNTSRIALYENDETALTRTVDETVLSMFEYTDEEGTLYIPDWAAFSVEELEEDDGVEHFFKCSMNWKREDAEKSIVEINDALDSIEAFAEAAPEADSVDAKNLVICARRVSRVKELGAPQVIINNEKNLFAQVWVLYHYCEKRELVDWVD